MYKVMLVDDEPFILDGLQKMLCWEEMGMEIAALCRDGQEALEFLRKEKADILITDIKMPKLTGIELLRNLQEEDISVKTIILSGFDDFEYIQQGVKLGIENFLLKPVDEVELISSLSSIVKKLDNENLYKKKVRDAEDILKENILYRFITDSIDNDEFIEKCELLHIDLNRRFYKVIFVSGQIDDHLKRLLNERLRPFGDCYMCQDYEDNLLILVAADELDDNAVDRLLETIARPARCGDLFITAGEMVEGSEHTPLSYQKAKKLQEHKMLPNHATFLNPEKKVLSDDIDFAVFLKNLNICMERQDKKGVEALLDELYAKLYTPEKFYNITMELVCNISAMVRDIKPGDKLFLSNLKLLFDDIYRLETVQAMKTWIQYIIFDCIDIIKPDEKDISPVIAEVLRFVGENYQSHISLKVIADKYNMNPVYLGQLFKKNIGESFTNYLNEIRVQEAKKLLINSTLKVKEISERVGYLNLNYFYTVFRQITGSTPTAFRQVYKI